MSNGDRTVDDTARVDPVVDSVNDTVVDTEIDGDPVVDTVPDTGVDTAASETHSYTCLIRGDGIPDHRRIVYTNDFV